MFYQNPYQSPESKSEGLLAKTRVVPYAIVVALIIGFVVLNFLPPENLSFDPWLCRSYAGASEVRDYGWPWHFKTVFLDAGSNKETVLTINSSILLNLVFAALVLGFAMLPFFDKNWFRKRVAKTSPQGQDVG